MIKGLPASGKSTYAKSFRLTIQNWFKLQKSPRPKLRLWEHFCKELQKSLPFHDADFKLLSFAICCDTHDKFSSWIRNLDSMKDETVRSSLLSSLSDLHKKISALLKILPIHPGDLSNRNFMEEIKNLVKSELPGESVLFYSQKEAEELRLKLEKQLADAQKTIQDMMGQARSEAEGARQKLLADAKAESERIIEKGRRDLTGETERLKLSLQKEVAGLSLAIAEKIVERSIDPKLQEDVIQKSLKSLGGSLS